jgi:hypothetical protein
MTVLYTAVVAVTLVGGLLAAALCRISALSDRETDRLWVDRLTNDEFFERVDDDGEFHP